MDVKIRAAISEDAHAISIIEQKTSPEPWSEDALLRDICQNDNACVLVAETDGKAVGYLDAWKVADELQLCNIGVLEEYRGNHIGQELMDVLADIGRELQCALITLEVRESNEPALALYRKCEFEEVGIRENYYIDNNENAILMDKKL